MFSTLRNRFGIPGVISVIALVFAMFGGAYAASNSSGGGKATASAKAKKGPRGKTGKTGPAGPAGPVGLAGPAGPKGDAGAAGSNGTSGPPGSPGAAGKSVTSTSFEGTDEPAGEPCNEHGGNSFKVEGSTEAHFTCNGANGANGSPWTAGGKLPPGATETGVWAFSAPYTEQPYSYVPISFSIPLAAELDDAHVARSFEDPTHCPGSPNEPKASSGYLCVYGGGNYAEMVAIVKSSQSLSDAGSGIGGAVLKFENSGEEAKGDGSEVSGAGSFAVTG